MNGRVRTPPESRFWKHVDKDGPIPEHRPELGPCWIWTGAKQERGYGKIGAEDSRASPLMATHVAWFIEHGEYPAKGVLACHHCDNPPCVRPSHLFLGTHEDNMRDMHRKGRAYDGSANPRGDAHWARLKPERISRGERQGLARLRERDIPVILGRLKAGETVSAVARDLGVSRGAIQGVRNGTTWQHLTQETVKHPAERSCIECGKQFALGVAKRSSALTCSRECRLRHRSRTSLASIEHGMPCARFSKAEAANVYARIAAGEGCYGLSQEFDVDCKGIRAIARGNYVANDGRFVAAPIVIPRRMGAQALALAGEREEFGPDALAEISGRSIGAAHSALLRLVRAGLIRRVGRGLYAATKASVVPCAARGEPVRDRLIGFDGEVSR